MEPILERRISIYQNAFDTVGSVTTLGAFLQDETMKDAVMAIRNEQDENRQKQCKKQMPQATISGVFGKRCADGIKEYSGLICIDIDEKDNPILTNHLQEVKRQLSAIPQIAYIGLSARGRGLFLIVPILYPKYHKLHFLQLQEDFRAMGLVIDTNCKDICRLRIQSYDPHPYINPNATIYERYKVEEKPIRKAFNYVATQDDTINKVARLCATIDHEGIDFTENYGDWVRIGFALADLGEVGREFYHVCSRQSSKYRPTECDKKFNNLT